MNEPFEEYRRWVGTHGPLDPCPVCGAEAEMWQFAEKEGDVAQRLVCCTSGEASEAFAGARGHLLGGCLLFMPPQDFYQPTARQAERHWNEFARACEQARLTAGATKLKARLEGMRVAVDIEGQTVPGFSSTVVVIKPDPKGEV